MLKQLVILLFLAFNIFLLEAQNRFDNEVANLQKKYKTKWNPNKETTLFTGSSSIRLWKNLDSLFPNKQIINTGFGASLSGDLLHFSDKLITNYNPTKVFIYEGDNDIAYDKSPKEVIENIKSIIKNIKSKKTDTYIVLISTKPSISRWHLKKKYKKLNRKLNRITKKDPLIHFVDVWKPMLNGKKLKKSLFGPDGLHMNKEGYNIWYTAIKKHVK
ncbi:lysophospholipase L1-like esterase [Maribacter vaceletii]|uniref:Lysophospholipase L1-like esterase n=1 Tax=Maribacter vaceletii TaxID=1206816 RepID=A0A495E8Y9_9FLAO|nr:GDSL-type esterase/lipase family protein [Maribacter vaceletii]RKR12277.1 lysophospholipase L1-like esterase [Maribacter vaceletii]